MKIAIKILNEILPNQFQRIAFTYSLKVNLFRDAKIVQYQQINHVIHVSKLKNENHMII